MNGPRKVPGGITFVLVIVGLAAILCSPATASDPARKVARLEFHLGQEAPGPSLTPIKTTDYAGTIYLQPDPALTNADLESAIAKKNEFNQPIVELKLTDAGFEKLKRLASENLHKRLAILIDGELLIAPVIARPVTDSTV